MSRDVTIAVAKNVTEAVVWEVVIGKGIPRNVDAWAGAQVWQPVYLPLKP